VRRPAARPPSPRLINDLLAVTIQDRLTRAILDD
jgi:hypothetical protein